MLKLFLQVPPFKKILDFQNQKRDYEICTKGKFQTKNQTKDENSKNELYQSENKQGKVLNLVLTRGRGLGRGGGVEKGSKAFFRVLEFLSKIPNMKKISKEE